MWKRLCGLFWQKPVVREVPGVPFVRVDPMFLEVHIGSGRRIRHKLPYDRAVQFAAILLNKPVATIEKGLRATPSLRSYTASNGCLFVRIASTMNSRFIPTDESGYTA